ncbi:RimJ/RimL family protein N-acetyltransferase [Chitinophaga sp. W2I13]|uniref:GNAT family N-acetyltransferase n=1 Tax=Chitinophaga sp. W2I13 TaxID=3373923 RepID=UPI003D1C3F55
MILRKATIEDWKILLDWRNDIETRKNSHKIEIIEEENHKKWLSSILAAENRQLFIAIDNELPVGTVRADFDDQFNAYELSWSISPEVRGKGVGKEMVKLLTDKLNTRIRAEIKSGNIASIKIAEYVGLTFKEEDNGILHYTNY